MLNQNNLKLLKPLLTMLYPSLNACNVCRIIFPFPQVEKPIFDTYITLIKTI